MCVVRGEKVGFMMGLMKKLKVHMGLEMFSEGSDVFLDD